MKDHVERIPNKLSTKEMNTIFQYVNESLGITMSDKGKKVVKGDVNRKMLQYDNDIEKVMNYFKNYDQELGKLYIAWESYDRSAFIYHLTRK
jgi:hypothetical protein